MSVYDDNFYNMISDGSYRSAKLVVPEFLSIVKGSGLDASSVVDWGCGRGAWLSAFKEEGLDVSGFDGDYVDRNSLWIDPSEFSGIDFEGNFDAYRDSGRWDVAISLEVAEHVSERNADDYVALVAQSSKLGIVLFSAAIPGQGGVGHVNEQWPDYWVDKFAIHGYKHVSDCLRWTFWEDEEVEPWYKQNLLILSRVDIYQPSGYHSVVHPIVWDHIRGSDG